MKTVLVCLKGMLFVCLFVFEFNGGVVELESVNFTRKMVRKNKCLM